MHTPLDAGPAAAHVANEALRTPDEAFAGLPDYAWKPAYVAPLPEAPDLRMHHLDEGRPDAPVALCLHGQPTWSYLYRKLVDPFLAHGMRVVAPDLIGFGRSDKPVDEDFHTFDVHRRSLLGLIDKLDLQRITLVCQDWGGLLGLTLPMARPQRFERLLVMNTAFAAGDLPFGPGFEAWRAFNRSEPDLDVGDLMRRATPTLSEVEARAYAAPFPTARHKAAVRRFPDLVPTRPDDPGAEISRTAREWWRTRWTGQSFMVVGARDPVIPPSAMEALRRDIRGCPDPLVLPDAGHFVQEAGAMIVEAAFTRFVAADSR